MEFKKDDFVFKKYGDTPGEWQCKIKLKSGILSIRYGGHGIITTNERPYEVWYPEDSAPTGDQTADDIWNYIRNGKT